MTTWFTSDTHFGHLSICELENRPFGQQDPLAITLEEKRAVAVERCRLMDKAIMENWNSWVSKDDQVWHLGDFAFHEPAKYLSQLNGSIHIVWGNHDDKSGKKIRGSFASEHEQMYFRHEGYRMHLSHYKLQVWRANYRGTWHLFGHSHGQLTPEACPGKCLDVGIMNKGWKPGIPWLYSFDELEAYMATRPFTQHHNPLDEE